MTIIAERLAALGDITLSPFGHSAPPKDARPQDLKLCGTEIIPWLRGEPHTASPPCTCLVIAAFIRGLNDWGSAATRAALIAHPDGHPELALVVRAMGTANDGHREQRGYIARDYAVRIGLPLWLDAAGATEAAAEARAHTVVTDWSSARSASALAVRIRDALVPGDYWEWRVARRKRIYRAAYDAATKALREGAAVAVAVAAAAAAAAAAAVAVAVAVADADAAADGAADAAAAAAAVAAAAAAAAAAAVAVAVAVADADAAAVAAADAAADAAAARWSETYKAVREELAKRRAHVEVPAHAAAVAALTRMVELGESDRVAP